MSRLGRKAGGNSSDRTRAWRFSRKSKAELIEDFLSAHVRFRELENVVSKRLGDDPPTALPPSVARLFIEESGPASLLSDYDGRYRRTIDIAARAIEYLQKNRLRVSLREIERVSAQVDATGRGISRRAVLVNKDAYDIYRKASKWPYRSLPKDVPRPHSASPSCIYRRVRRLSKPDLACAIVEVLNVVDDMETRIMRANLLVVKSLVADLL